MPRISVIVPAYNAQACLDKCIASILAQSFSDIELIVIDDGSKDATAAICDKWAAADSRVRAVHKANGGVSQARNTGLDMANGELISFVDADDHILPEMYATMLQALDACTADTALCNFTAEAPDGSLSPYGRHIPGGYYSSAQCKNMVVNSLLCERLNAAFNGFVWCYLFDRRSIEKHSLRFTGAYLEDELFLIEYFSLGHTLAICDEELYRYCLNPSSVTRRYLAGYCETFKHSFATKKELVEKYSISVSSDWEYTTLWAGLLIAVANEFAPGNPFGKTEKFRHLKQLCTNSIFSEAVRTYSPAGLGLKKTVVATLIRFRQYRALAALYNLKNRNRS